ncbi:unnamed protein product [Nesidiocoris tenuis]|uniref:Sulfatase N-terminal domain-containing protein n=1 Tax=Nesidiocoris tenuis TaxID=355587 RepID=A0A6H5HCV8_9HEMI|nr:unnamed protein product [Nesidiocoris tenuis]
MYGEASVGGPQHVPPGWDDWVGLVGNSRYYNYTLSINGTPFHHKDQYLTNVLSSYALDFLDRQTLYGGDSPFLMVIAPPAPHQPFTPEPKYKGAFRQKAVPREPHFNRANNSDKHWLVRMQPSPLPLKTIALLDHFYASRWETLLSVDDLVKEVVEKLRSAALLDETYIIFTSDNGFHLGQFSMPWDKRQPYEFDTRVPFMMRGPGIGKKSLSKSPVALVDIFPTLLQIAGLESRPTDGRSIIPIAPTGNRTLIFEYKGEGSFQVDHSCPWDDLNLSHCSAEACCKCQDVTNNTYSCIRSIADPWVDFLYCRFEDNESWGEVYNMTEDPYQLNNLYPLMDSREKQYYDSLLPQ